MSHRSSGGPIVHVCVCPCWSLSVILLVRMTHPLSAACQDVSSFVRWTTLCVYVCVCVLVSPFAVQDDPSFVSSLSRCLIFRQVDQLCVYVCVFVSLLVLLLVRMTHPLSAACQDVSSFVRWTTLCVYVCVCPCQSFCWSG